VVTKLAARTSRASTLNANYDWKEVESKARAFQGSPAAKSTLEKKLSKKRSVGYVEGPPTLNNQPHIGHVRGRMMKDAWYRYWTLRGRRIRFRAGWDTQGLPVELQAEKELGLSGNKWVAITTVGEDRLVKACKELVAKYERSWLEADRLLGLSIDHDRAYRTFTDRYIEREWKYLETAWKRGLLGEGFKVVPYCPGCMTSLSHAEAASEYETLEDPSLFYKVKAEDGAYLAIWTTMPFTVVTDELVGVKPDAEYVYVRVGPETWVLGADRMDAFGRETGARLGRVMKRVKGKDLEGMKYSHPLIEIIPGLDKLAAEGKIHRVVAEEFVDTSTGTGLVHLAPANGEEDFQVALDRKLPVFSPFDDEARFTDEAGRFSGTFVRDADGLVSALLKARGAYIFEGRIRHEYPTCWRSGHRLVWVARREYFYWLERLKDDLVKAAEGVEYYYEAPRNRFLQFIRDARPWCISRERFWGSPLPIWACVECGEKVPAFSRAAILKRAVELPDGPDFELHRPWIDRVVLKCPKCGSRAHRELFVLDTWHNSGAAPYASFTNEEFRSLVPVEFLTEAMDQTRGWAYTLLALNVILTGKPRAPYKAFLFQGFVLDEGGRKMSKSLGNTVWGLDVLRHNSVDVTRLYITGKSSPPESLTLDLKEMASRPYQVLNTLYHLHVYLRQNGAVDGYDPSKHTLDWASRRGLLDTVDRWLLAKLAEASASVSASFEGGRFNEACGTLEDLTIAHLSQTYIRLVRTELWRDDPKERRRRLAIYSVLGHALRTVDELLHPVSPFITEYLYQEVFARRKWKAPLLAVGAARERTVGGTADAERMVDLALKVEGACNSARMRAGLKRRWPLRTLKVMVSEADLRTAKRAVKTIESLCNAKQAVVTASASDFPSRFKLVPNASRIGAQFKERTKDVLDAAAPLEGEEAVRAYVSGNSVPVDTRSGRVEVPMGAYELEITPDEGTVAVEKGGVFAAMDKERDEKLVAEGLLRDVARRLQALRKKRGFVPTAVLASAAVAGLEPEETAQLESMKKQLAFLVRVKKVTLSVEKTEQREWAEDDLDGRPVYLDVR
jgi:isoleucyl-tRNA synthetase